MRNIQLYVPFIATVVFIIINIELIKKEKLKENFGVFWVTISILMLVCVLNIDLLVKVAEIFGTKNVAAIFYSLSIFVLFVIGLGLSVKMSTYSKHIKNLNQQVAILTCILESNQKKNFDGQKGTN